MEALMETRQLGDSDLLITPIGFGSWAIGGGNWEFGWGPQDDEQAIRAIQTALDLGVNWIDTAAIYGLGHSEELVGRAVKGRADRPYIFTKCSMVWNAQADTPHGLKPGGFSVRPRRQPRESPKALPEPLDVSGRVLVSVRDIAALGAYMRAN
jgi:aryl-alcohol dehydrogenase-like predicted oxidoreductase